jgi:pSer/pThr/pTyr-binding forkhead associated (FHA) protein
VIRLTALIEIEGQAPRALTHESNARTIIIGRDGSADFQIPLSTISRQHMRISVTDGIYVIEDLGSTHGTALNGKRLEKGEKKILRNGDLIELTRARITADIEEQKVVLADPSEGTRAIAAKAVEGILGRLGEARGEGPFLRIISGPEEGARFQLGGIVTEWAVGRSTDCEIVLNDPNVSRRHALVKKDWNGFSIMDLGSKNGVLINDKLIQKPRRLRDKDEIIIGPVKLAFVDPDAALLDALKDVPGFGADEAEPTDDAPSHLGAPEAAAEPAAGADADSGAAASAASPLAPAVEEEPDLSGIDPELLEPAHSRFPIEWIVIGTGVVVLAAVVGAILFLVS